MYFITFLFKNLLQRKLRSGLTAAGVAVAVGATVSLTGISHNLKQGTLNSLQQRSVSLVVVEEGKIDQLGSSINADVVDKVRKFPEVKSVGPSLFELESIEVNGNYLNVMIQGWEPDSYLFDGLDIIDGRGLRKGDGKVAVIGKKAAENFNRKVNDTLTIEREEWKIVGIFDSFNFMENGQIIVPLSALQEAKFRPDEVTGFSVVLRPGGDEKHEEVVARVQKQINELEIDGEPARVTAYTTQEYAGTTFYLNVMQAMAWLTSAIAMVVGSIGVINTMVMSVVERVREISTMRAIGWRKRRIVQMIVGESLILSLVGAVLGVAGAMIATQLLTRFPAVSGFIEGTISPVIIAQGFLLALCAGLIGGALPAWRATRLQPAEGLRYE